MSSDKRSVPGPTRCLKNARGSQQSDET